MAKITFDEFIARLSDVSIPERDLADLLVPAPRDKALPIELIPNPERVELDDRDQSGIRIGNGLCRRRRQVRFNLRMAAGDPRPVLVSEGDSWFQFPILIDDVIDHLGDDYSIWSLDAAGDTALNMVDLMPEYLDGLKRQKHRPVRAFLFSAAGNDVIGEDENGVPTLARLLRPFRPGQSAAEHIDQGKLSAVLAKLEQSYRKVIGAIRNEPGFEALPILVHGYDYAIPGGQPGDPRDPIYASPTEWLGDPLTENGIVDGRLQRAIIRELIDALYGMLGSVAGDSASTGVHLINARDAIPEDQWNDEIHGTDAGFKSVADRFRRTLRGLNVS